MDAVAWWVLEPDHCKREARQVFDAIEAWLR